MNASGLHRVRRLRWQASAATPEEGLALRTLLHGHSDALQAALARAFDLAWPGDQVLHLSRLDVVLEPVDLAAPAAELTARVEGAARRAVGEVLAARSAAVGVLRDAAERTAPAAAAGPAGGGAQEAQNLPVRITDAATTRREALRHYLASGNLHWTLAALAPERADALLRQAALEAVADLAAGACSDSFVGPGGATAAIWAALVLPAWPAARRAGAVARWLLLLTARARVRLLGLAAPPAVPEPLRARWQEWLDREVARMPPLALQAAWLVAGDDRAAARDWAAAAAHWLRATDNPLNQALALAQQCDAFSREQVRNLARAADPAVVPLPAPGARPADGVASPPSKHAEDAEEAEEAEEAAGLLVPLAGLVLLHPFVPRLLQACGLHDTALPRLAPGPLPRACALLHALAVAPAEPDQPPPSEHQLPLVKLLLGIAPDEPLASPLPSLHMAEREEAQSLLLAAIAHWSALGRTSVDGLRSGFLQRQGLLDRAAGGWRLRVQAEPWDMLLERLPWSISLVRLPWMPEPLRVEWRDV